jgi:hypothetical protein
MSIPEQSDWGSSCHTPPSGVWTGYYLYYPNDFRHLQRMMMNFTDGELNGHGDDDLGRFAITGFYGIQSNDVTWLKQYLAAHAVGYRGFYERGFIWGVWNIGATRGGFKIWPIIKEAKITLVKSVELAMSDV